MMELEEIKKGIEPYKKQQKRILEFIKKNNNRIMAKQFDEEFDVIRKVYIGRDKKGLQMFKNILISNNYMGVWDENAFILGNGFLTCGGNTVLSQWIHLLQIMVELKLIKRRIYKKGQNRVFYYLSNEKNPNL